MSLFDGQPLDLKDIEEKMQGRLSRDSVTMKDKKGRATRRQPYHVDLGRGPQGKHCADCEHLFYRLGMKRYYKCGMHPVTNGNATDIGAKDLACRNFEQTDEVLETCS